MMDRASKIIPAVLPSGDSSATKDRMPSAVTSDPPKVVSSHPSRDVLANASALGRQGRQRTQATLSGEPRSLGQALRVLAPLMAAPLLPPAADQLRSGLAADGHRDAVLTGSRGRASPDKVVRARQHEVVVSVAAAHDVRKEQL